MGIDNFSGMLTIVKRLIWVVLFLGIAVSFVTKDYAIARIAALYLTYSLGGQCQIKTVRLGVNEVTVSDFSFIRKDISCDFKKGVIGLNWLKPTQPRIISLAIEDGNFRVKTGTPGLLGGAVGGRNINSPFFSWPIAVEITHIDFGYSDPKIKNLHVRGSFSGELNRTEISSVKGFELNELDFETENVRAEGIYLTDSFDERREIVVPFLKIKDRVIENTRLPFIVQKNQMIFAQTSQPLLGKEAGVSGVVEFVDYKNFCATIRLINVAGEEVVRLIRDKDDLALRGDFGGKVRLCVRNARVSAIDGVLDASGGGFINIKKDVPVGFLKDKLTPDSYQALVDNFRNYTYNKGKIEVHKEADMISVSVHFNSQNMGVRNLTINLHDFL
ncbi:MAG: hypothetical protein JXD21_03130 [Candidatus Omnitrophica bacterium]|nr:hypothetical protein [Candidatus Omnitrophota bacterium]